MNTVPVALRVLFGAALLASAVAAPPANAQAAFGPLVNKPTPALAEFERVSHGVLDYTTTAVVFEQLNDASRVETRTYAYKVLGPHAAFAAIVSGPGHGAAAAWTGDGMVKQHVGGPLAPIKLTVAIDDPRVQTLRGDTIDTGTFRYDLLYMLATPGTLAEAAGPTYGSVATTSVTLKVKDPGAEAVTKVVLDISKSSHLPMRRTLYVGSTIVKTETFVDTKINVGLKPEDIDV
jgi:hypothetical protein